MKGNYALFIGIALVVVLIDQASKLLALSQLAPHQILSVIPGFFNIVLVENRGMAFGILNQAKPGLSYIFCSPPRSLP